MSYVELGSASPLALLGQLESFGRACNKLLVGPQDCKSSQLAKASPGSLAPVSFLLRVQHLEPLLQPFDSGDTAEPGATI